MEDKLNVDQVSLFLCSLSNRGMLAGVGIAPNAAATAAAAAAVAATTAPARSSSASTGQLSNVHCCEATCANLYAVAATGQTTKGHRSEQPRKSAPLCLLAGN